MKRRTFISTLAALAATPALPATVAAAPATHITQHFAKAKLLARCHDRASPEMFARLMKLDDQTAKGVYTMLKDRNVIANGIDGISRAINPLNTHCVPNEALKARDFAKISSDVSKRLRDMAKKRVEEITEQTEEARKSLGRQKTSPHQMSRLNRYSRTILLSIREFRPHTAQKMVNSATIACAEYRHPANTLLPNP